MKLVFVVFAAVYWWRLSETGTATINFLYLHYRCSTVTATATSESLSDSALTHSAGDSEVSQAYVYQVIYVFSVCTIYAVFLLIARGWCVADQRVSTSVRVSLQQRLSP
jgi:hypothetical protein